MLERYTNYRQPRYFDVVSDQIKMAQWHEPTKQPPEVLKQLTPERWALSARVCINCSTFPINTDEHANYRKAKNVFTEEALKRRKIHDSTQTVHMGHLRMRPDDMLDIAADSVSTAKSTAIIDGTGRYYGEIRQLPKRRDDSFTALQIVYGEFLSSRLLAAKRGWLVGMVAVRTPSIEILELELNAFLNNQK